jgi:hypothetical protein
MTIGSSHILVEIKRFFFPNLHDGVGFHIQVVHLDEKSLGK